MPDKVKVERAHITYRVTPDQLESLKIECAKRRTSLQDLIEQALGLLLQQDDKDKPVNLRLHSGVSIAYDLSTNERKWVDVLIKILRSGDQFAKHGIVANLSWADLWLDSQEGVERAEKAAPVETSPDIAGAIDVANQHRQQHKDPKRGPTKKSAGTD